MARYFVQNLVRDYDLADRFGAQVWRENLINGVGIWEFRGSGIQELGANYFEIQVPPGVYSATLTGRQGDEMSLWAIGIRDNQADAFALGSGGLFTTEGYDFFYLMVFNPVYDEDLDECTFYTDYGIEVEAGGDQPTGATVQTFDASKFAPLGQ
jgi:hypothetical protein